MGVIFRGTGAIIAGLIVATMFAMGVEYMGSILHPFPVGADPSNIEAIRAHVARYPAGVLLLASLGWGLGTLASSWLATRLGPNRRAVYGVAVGLILLALAVYNMSMLPYPVWFWISNFIVLPAGFCFGARLARGRVLRA